MPIQIIRDFIKLKSASGILLLVAAFIALILDNSPFSSVYNSIVNAHIGFNLGIIHYSQPVIFWINDGLMTFFFLLVGLEIKREMIEGELNSTAKIMLPAIAALGGMIMPAIIYIVFNWHDKAAINGWAIPTATDIAFALGVIALLGSRIPLAVKIFLTALAIFDDIGAIIIIAIFYSHNFSLLYLLLALALVGVLVILNCLAIMRITPYLIVGILLWFCLLHSGVHAVLAGVILALAIPVKNSKQLFFSRSVSPLKKLEQQLHPWVAYAIVPIFGFANAGVNFTQITFQHLLAPITLGIALGLFVGKQIGVFLSTWLAVKMKIAALPKNANWQSIYGVSLLCGIGFTMSLFIGALAFETGNGVSAALVRAGILFGSIISGLLGYMVLNFVYRKNKVI